MPVTKESDEFISENDEVRLMHFEMQRMIESSLQVLQESALDCGIEAKAKANVVSLLEAVYTTNVKGRKNSA